MPSQPNGTKIWDAVLLLAVSYLSQAEAEAVIDFLRHLRASPLVQKSEPLSRTERQGYCQLWQLYRSLGRECTG